MLTSEISVPNEAQLVHMMALLELVKRGVTGFDVVNQRQYHTGPTISEVIHPIVYGQLRGLKFDKKTMLWGSYLSILTVGHYSFSGYSSQKIQNGRTSYTVTNMLVAAKDGDNDLFGWPTIWLARKFGG